MKQVSLGDCMRYRVPPATVHDCSSMPVTDAARSKHERVQWRLWSCQGKLMKLTRAMQDRGHKVPDRAKASCMCVHPSLWTVLITHDCVPAGAWN